MRLNRNKSGGAGAACRRPGRGLGGRLGLGALLFFAAKGLVWLAVGGVAAAGLAAEGAR
jgi:hypothetical protein